MKVTFISSAEHVMMDNVVLRRFVHLVTSYANLKLARNASFSIENRSKFEGTRNGAV
jgi:hypothetical protein